MNFNANEAAMKMIDELVHTCRNLSHMDGLMQLLHQASLETDTAQAAVLVLSPGGNAEQQATDESFSSGGNAEQSQNPPC